MKYANKELHFTVENSKEDFQKKAEAHSGIGLNNVQKRLALLYPSRHILQVVNNPCSFRVSLTISI
ncbi:MAG: histidine kinase, partial [Ferruginibacter sp.]